MARSSSMSPGTQARNLAMPNQWHDQLSMFTRTQVCNYQCQTNGHDLQLICLEQGQDYSLSVIKAESLYQLSIFRDVRLKLGFISVITSYAVL